MFRHNNFACGLLCLLIVALTATMFLYNVSCGDKLIKGKKPKNINIQPFLINIFQLHSNAVRIYDYCVVQQNFHFSIQAQSEFRLCNRAKFRKFRTLQLIITKKNSSRRNLDSGAFQPSVTIANWGPWGKVAAPGTFVLCLHMHVL